MGRREAIEAALAAWRDAERRQAQATDGDRERLTVEVERHRTEFQGLSAEHMLERIDSLQEAEQRRREATPSTPPFHEAARDTKEIAAEIWEAARESDEDTPQTAANQRTAGHHEGRSMGAPARQSRPPPASDQTLADADQTSANADQELSSVDQGASDSDNSAAALDQRNSEHDQVNVDRAFAGIEHPTDEEERRHLSSRRARDAVTMARGENRRTRARASRDRDATAGQRERTVDARDERRVQRDEPAG